ncbi:MAG TPA: protein kinase [Vicinamibacterales bacterium]|jgi:TolB-like protein/Flp pilus assembly protein TadD
MSTSDASRLLDLAASIADGASVDWSEPAGPLSARERRVFDHLRVIDSLAELYRSLPAQDDEPAGDPYASPEPAGPHWGRLILLDRIGQGTSGDVFRAWDVELQREVALKLLHVDGVSDAAANARLLGEARRLARVRHPNVVHVYGAERHEERIGLWMELVRGRTLDDVVRGEGPMAMTEALAIGADLAGAVAAVHAAGLLHRDVKAQNVIREDSGRVVLMDFGTGEEIASARPALAGTPLYLAPEILGGAEASPASDVYSLGVLLFYLVSGRYPVHADTVEALTAAHRAGRRTLLAAAVPASPRTFARIVDRALSPDPQQRYATAAELEQALRGCLRQPAQPLAGGAWRSRTMAAVTAVAVIALTATVWRPWARPVPPAAATSIAVLPLTYVSGAADAPSFADGLTDQLVTTLGQISALRVTALTSVLRFRQTNRPIAAVASELGVGSVLEGSVAVQGSGSGAADPRVRVNLRLIRAGTDVELWSDSFERPLSDILALQADIARAVARSVQARLSQAEEAHLAKPAQVSAPAQRAYLEGISYLRQNRHGTELLPAKEAFERAIALDPTFAPPHAALARTYVSLGDSATIAQADAYAAAVPEARRALALDPSRSDAYTTLADLSFRYEWDWSGAEAGYKQAIALDASDPYARTQYARLLAALGRVDEARREAETAVAIDPLTADVKLTAGLMAFYQRRYPEAEEILRQVLRMDPRSPGAYVVMGRIQEAQKRYADALSLIERGTRLTDIPPWRADVLRVRALAGDQPGAREGLARLKQELAGSHQVLEPEYEAYVRLALGDRDAALELLSSAVDARNPNVLWMAVDPRLDSLRDDPRFRNLIARLGRP